MAQIVTITNPLTGQPAQVDQLDHTAQQIDDGLNIARGVSNPNLLDNWYFGNPVDQRQGRVVVPNTTYYSDNQLTTAAGTTSAYVTAYRYATGTASGVSYASFKLTDSDTAPTYYAAPENVVRGYTGTGYGIDRWKTNSPYTTALIKDDCVEVISTADSSTMGVFSQPTTLKELGVHSGDTVTLSFLSEIVSAPNGDIRLQIDNDTKKDYSQGALIQAVVGSKTIYSITKTIPATWEKTDIIRITMFRTGSFDVKEYAAKLELGTAQTLAHQDENGNWVLNEIPNYGEQLARCQRYQLVLGSKTYSAIGIGVGRTTNDVFTSIPTPVTMRTVPTATIQGVVVARCNGVYLNATETAEIMHSPGTINLAFNVSEVQSGAPYDVFLKPGSKLILNANL